MCQLDAISSCFTPSKLRQVLDSLPDTLDETYERILCGINPLHKQDVLRVLQWLTVAKRHLSIEEVAEIFTLGTNYHARFEIENRLAEPKDILSTCSSLVTFSKIPRYVKISSYYQYFNSKTYVNLAHYSVKEYLVSNRICSSPAASFSINENLSHATIADMCLRYIQQLEVPNSVILETKCGYPGMIYQEAWFPDLNEFITRFPLAKYSTRFWYEHLLATKGKERLPQWALLSDLHRSRFALHDYLAMYRSDRDAALGWALKFSALTD